MADARIVAIEKELAVLQERLTTSAKWATFVALCLFGFLGYTNFVTIPKEADDAAARSVVGEVQQRIQLLAEETDRKQKLFEEQISKANSDFTTLIKPVSERLGPMQLTALCVQRTDDGCNPYPRFEAMKCDSDAGWFDTTMVLSNVVPGGSCGFGPICRICGKYAGDG